MSRRLSAEFLEVAHKLPGEEELEHLPHVDAVWSAGTAPTTYLWTMTTSCPYCGARHLECWKWPPLHTRVACPRCGNAYVTDARGVEEE